PHKILSHRQPHLRNGYPAIPDHVSRAVTIKSPQPPDPPQNALLESTGSRPHHPAASLERRSLKSPNPRSHPIQTPTAAETPPGPPPRPASGPGTATPEPDVPPPAPPHPQSASPHAQCDSTTPARCECLSRAARSDTEPPPVQTPSTRP